MTDKQGKVLEQECELMDWRRHMAARALEDKQYKDGYQVLDGGDYLVHTEGTKYEGKHKVIRLADGAMMGEYLSRAAANRRAQQLGGNSARSRRSQHVESSMRCITEPISIFAYAL